MPAVALGGYSLRAMIAPKDLSAPAPFNSRASVPKLTRL